VQFLTSLYNAFLETDASLVEINPFVSCTDGRLFGSMPKLNFDDNAMFRHADLKECATSQRKIRWKSRLEVQPQLHQS